MVKANTRQSHLKITLRETKKKADVEVITFIKSYERTHTKNKYQSNTVRTQNWGKKFNIQTQTI